jgi:hypothetical protein
MTGKPIPLGLDRFAGMIGGAREFLRVWAKSDGAVVCFVDPVPVGPDPVTFGEVLADCARQAAKAYAQAVNIGEDEALARIWQGFDAGRAAKDNDPITFTTVERR